MTEELLGEEVMRYVEGCFPKWMSSPKVSTAVVQKSNENNMVRKLPGGKKQAGRNY